MLAALMGAVNDALGGLSVTSRVKGGPQHLRGLWETVIGEEAGTSSCQWWNHSVSLQSKPASASVNPEHPLQTHTHVDAHIHTGIP